MLTAPFAYALAALLAYILCIAVYTYSQALAGWAAGIHVEEVSVGFGPSLWERTIRHCKYRVGCILLGGYTRYAGAFEDEKVPRSEAGVPLGKRLVDTPAWARLLLFLVGPASNLLIGIALIGVAVWVGAPQMATTTPAESLIQPCAVGGLTFTQPHSTWDAQWQLFRGTGLEFIWRVVALQSLEDWGGYLGLFITAGQVATASGWGWFTCIGILYVCMGGVNLVPIPAMNGFHALGCVLELIGLPLPRQNLGCVYFIGVLLTCSFMCRVFWIDIRWCWGVLFS